MLFFVYEKTKFALVEVYINASAPADHKGKCSLGGLPELKHVVGLTKLPPLAPKTMTTMSGTLAQLHTHTQHTLNSGSRPPSISLPLRSGD